MTKVICTAVLTTLFWLEPASALDLSIQPRFKTGIQYYEYETTSFQSVAQGSQGQFFNSRGKARFQDWLPFVSGGATVFFDRMFVDFDVQQSFNGEDSSDFNNQDFIAGGNPIPTDTIGRTRNTMNANFDRFEWAVSVGFEIYENLVLFAGYKQSKADFNTDIQGDFDSFQARNMTPIPFLTGSYTGELDLELEYDGPFVGTSYNWRIQQGFVDGVLAFNFAAAFLEGDVDLTFHNVTANTVANGAAFDFQTFSEGQWDDIKGDSIGLSFGVAWRGITQISGLTYSMGVAGYRYEFDSNDAPDFNETQVRIDSGLAYAFDI